MIKMKNENTTLKVGDKLYRWGGFGNSEISVCVVERLTKTQAVAKCNYNQMEY